MNTMNILPFQSEYVTKGEFYGLKLHMSDGFETLIRNIDAVETNLSAKIDANEASLSKKIGNVELRLAERIGVVEQKIDAAKNEIIGIIKSK